MSNIKLVFRYAFRDLTRQKLRTLIGIMGIMISVGLLAIVLFLSDSISVSFVDYFSVSAGNQDMNISVRHYNGEPEDRSTYFEYQPVIEKIQGSNSSNIIGSYIPRLEVTGEIHISEGYDTTKITEFTETALISGIDFSLESEKNLGFFKTPDGETKMNLPWLSKRHCAIYYEFNNVIKYSKGDTIKVEMEITHGDKKIARTVNLIVDEIFDYNTKWPDSYRRNLIVVDVNTLYDVFGADEFEGRCSKLIVLFKGVGTLYDVRDIGGSEIRVKAIAADIQKEIGLEEYSINLPKLTVLGYSEFLSLGVTIIFTFVAIIGCLISGVLINGILKTSVEERIREFGIFRTLGATKNYSLAIVLVQGFLLCNFGTIAGILMAYFASVFFLLPFAQRTILESLVGLGGELVFALNISSIIIVYSMGIGVGLIVSIAPALKVRNLQLIESIHPYRHEDTLYHLQKKASVNYKLIIIGLILSGNGLFVYMAIPRILFSADMSLLAGTLVAILMIFLIGLTLAGLGLMPIVLRGFIQLFRPFSKRLHHVIKIFVFRYQRRNTSTIIIFAMSFSFVMFTSTVIQTLSSQMVTSTRMRFGSDLVMETDGWEQASSRGGFGGGMGFFASSSETESISVQADSYSINTNRIMTTNFEEELLKFNGIERVSSVLASPWQLTQVYSEVGKEFSAEIGDFAGLTMQGISLYGIDEKYPSTVDSSLIKFVRGDEDEAFDQIFQKQNNFTCIISEGIAVSLSIDLGDKIRMSIQRGDELEIYVFTIVGTASAMAGFSGFGSSSMAAANGGVLISQETYIEIMDIPRIVYIDRFFIKLSDNSISNSRNIQEQINDEYEYYYDYYIINLESRVLNQQRLFSTIDAVFTLILSATIIICLFGLISSSYSTILERKKEIGILRTLGLKGKDINNLFIIEALIIMLSSGTVGSIMGWGTGYLLSGVLNLLSDSPVGTAIPLTNLITVFTASIIFVLIGMKFLLRKVRKKKIVDIYRETM